MKLAQLIVGTVLGSPILYWYASLWHHWTANNIHWWPHCLALSFILALIALAFGDKYSQTVPAKVMQLLLFSSLIAQLGVWFGLLTKPIF